MLKEQEVRSNLLGDLIRRIGTSYEAFRSAALKRDEAELDICREEVNRMIRLIDMMLDYLEEYDKKLILRTGRFAFLLQ